MPSHNRRWFGKLLAQDEHAAGSGGALSPEQPAELIETVAFGAGDRVLDRSSRREGTVQTSYIEGRTVYYSVRWDDGSHSPKNASELKLQQRNPRRV